VSSLVNAGRKAAEDRHASNGEQARGLSGELERSRVSRSPADYRDGTVLCLQHSLREEHRRHLVHISELAGVVAVQEGQEAQAGCRQLIK
jgi:hypothetical protein